MMNDIEVIKIIIMEGFYEYKSPLEYTELEYNLINEIDHSNSIENLETLINLKEYKEIKDILIKDKFYSNLKNKNYLPVQINFVEKIKYSNE